MNRAILFCGLLIDAPRLRSTAIWSASQRKPKHKAATQSERSDKKLEVISESTAGRRLAGHTKCQIVRLTKHNKIHGYTRSDASLYSRVRVRHGKQVNVVNQVIGDMLILPQYNNIYD